jgi:hypothetical protein
MTRDYACRTLRVSANASLDEIKYAYRTQAKRLHPDQNSDPGAAQRFKLLKDCYEFLQQPKAGEQSTQQAAAYNRSWAAQPAAGRQKKTRSWIWFIAAILLLIFLPSISSRQKKNSVPGKIAETVTVRKPDFTEGQGVDANNNGLPDFIVRNGRFTGAVSGKDFGPATLANLNARKTSAPVPVKPAPVKPVPVKPAPVKPSAAPTAAAAINYISYSNFKSYAYYPVRQFLDATGWTLSSNGSRELPEDLKNKIRKIGDYLHEHYTYGTYKAADGIGQDNDNVFDCDDFAGLMYRMGREAGLEMYIIDLPDHWANAVRYGNTLYTVEPQGVQVKYRDTSKFGTLTVADYARYTERIVVER